MISIPYLPYIPGLHSKGAKVASLFLQQCRVLAPIGQWHEPNFQAWSPEQEYLCEWRTTKQALSVYFGDSDSHFYIKSWGIDYVNDMEEGKLSTVDQLLELVNWVYAGKKQE